MTIQPWCGPDDLGGPCTDVELDAGIVTKAIALSSEILYYLSGSRWAGVKTETVRPMSSEPCGCGWASTDPARRNAWRGGARCAPVRQQELGGFPVVSIEQVKVYGDVIDPARYRVDDRRYLTAVRSSADQDRLWWPSCQRLDLPDTEEGTWSVRYRWGAAPPAAGAAASAALACELALMLAGDDEDGPGCRLPAAWTSITRAGVTVTRAGVDALAQSGLTGLPEVDLWLVALRKAPSLQGAAIIDPAKSRSVRRTGS